MISINGPFYNNAFDFAKCGHCHTFSCKRGNVPDILGIYFGVCKSIHFYNLNLINDIFANLFD